MKVETKLFTILALVFLPIAPIYGYLTNWEELLGPTALFLTSMLAGLIAYYLWFTGRKIDPRPEDDEHALIDSAEGEYGFFSPHSWWPLFLGAGAAICFAGLAVEWWLFMVGVLVSVISVVGWTFEYFKGEYAQ